VFSFTRTITHYALENDNIFINSDDVFVVKGIALDVHRYGRAIQVIEDLKGNFTGKTSIFVWGPSRHHGERPYYRLDDIVGYDKNDTLIMVVRKVSEKSHCDPEKSGDYATFDCSFSVLKLSNDSVIGNILPRKNIEDRWWETMTREEMISFLNGLGLSDTLPVMGTMPWEELQKLLQKLLKSN
jgi:hypothetical protein